MVTRETNQGLVDAGISGRGLKQDRAQANFMSDHFMSGKYPELLFKVTDVPKCHLFTSLARG